MQLFALGFLAFVYVFRLVWLLKFRSRKELSFPAGSSNAGIVYSMLNVAMPWAMESTRKKPAFYIQFAIFHLGVVAAISATLIIPYGPEIFEYVIIVRVFQAIIGAAFLVGIWRLYRRLRQPAMRLISTADDYFSLSLMIFYFAAGVLAVPNNYETSEWPLIIFFGLTAVFLIYVPFSKICHYLYYPFTRYFLGRTTGHRGVVAKKSRI